MQYTVKGKDRKILSLILIFIFTIPFNINEKIVGKVHFLFGEFYIYLYFYSFLVLIVAIIILKYKIEFYLTKNIKIFISLNIISIILSCIINWNNIVNNIFKQRTGIEKMFLQIMVILLVFILIIVIFSLLKNLSEKYSYYLINENIKKCIKYLTIFMIVYCTLQYINMNIARVPIFDYLEFFTRNNSSVYSRIRFVSYEASWFGMNLVIILSFLLSDINRNPKSINLWVQLILVFFFIMESNSRFSLLISIIIVVINFTLNIYRLSKKNKLLLFGIGLIFIALIIGIVFFTQIDSIKNNYLINTLDSIINYEGTNYEVSNSARYGMTDAAIKMGKDNILGVGIGQYGFEHTQYFNNDYYTWQTYKWASEDFSAWPTVHNLYARIFSELGIIGLISWINIFINLFTILFRKFYRSKSDNFDFQLCIMLIIGTFLIGFNQDGFVNPVFLFTIIYVNFILYCKKNINELSVKKN